MRTKYIGGKFTKKTRRTGLQKAVDNANAVALKYGSNKRFNLNIIGKVELTEVKSTKTKVEKPEINKDSEFESKFRLVIIKAVYQITHDLNEGITPSMNDVMFLAQNLWGTSSWKACKNFLSQLVSRMKKFIHTSYTGCCYAISDLIGKVKTAVAPHLTRTCGKVAAVIFA